MGFTSILDKMDSTYKNRPKPKYLEDLNLDLIIEQIRFQYVEDVRAFYWYFPENEACERYRREVYGDVKKESIKEGLADFINQMQERAKALNNKAEVELDMQKAVWHLWEVYHYCNAFERLYYKLSGRISYLDSEIDKAQNQKIPHLQPTSEGFRSFVEYLDNYLADEKFVQMKIKCYALIGKLKNFHLVLKLENDNLFIGQEELEGNYESFLDKSFPERKELRSPFAANRNMSNLEMELFKLLNKKNSAFFEEISSFYGAYEQYADEVLLRFKQEIGFYLAFYRFEEGMKSEDFAFAVPEMNPKKEMQAAGLYDLALACVNCRENKEVISNDMVYHEGEKFFVVTGPNQGGKTTFARSLGQLVYFTKMGLDVPAVAANVHYFSDVLSHFSVEESIETGRGKLKEELARLAPMMKDGFENAFIIINELFTTAANYDACIMGKRVLKHFLEQNCRGVYVTHLKELSEGEQIVSLRALVEEVEVPVEEAANMAKTQAQPTKTKIKNIRKFKIIRGEADNLGYAGDLVDKYRLSYEQICERIKRKQDGQKGAD